MTHEDVGYEFRLKKEMKKEIIFWKKQNIINLELNIFHKKY